MKTKKAKPATCTWMKHKWKRVPDPLHEEGIIKQECLFCEQTRFKKIEEEQNEGEE